MNEPKIKVVQMAVMEGFRVNPEAKTENEILASNPGILRPKWMSKEEILKEYPRK